MMMLRNISWKIVRGDLVHVRSGKDKNKQGTVLQVIRKENKVLVSGVNFKFKHKKPDQENPSGVIERKEYPIHISTVALIDPETLLPTRTKWRFLEDGTKVRIAKSGAMIPKPDRSDMTYQKRNMGKTEGVKDTSYDVALKQTYFGLDYDKIKQEFEEYIQERERQASWLVFDE